MKQGLTASAAVGSLKRGDDRNARLLACDPTLSAEDVALEQRKERFPSRRCRQSPAAPTHRPDQAVAAQGADEFPAAKLRPMIGMNTHPATEPHRATADSRVATVSLDFIRSLMHHSSMSPAPTSVPFGISVGRAKCCTYALQSTSGRSMTGVRSRPTRKVILAVWR